MRRSNDDQTLHAKRTFEAVSVFFLLEVLERIMTKIDLEMQTSGIIIKWQKLSGVTLFALINPHDTLQAVSEILSQFANTDTATHHFAWDMHFSINLEI